MLTITITGETPEDVKNQLQAFDKALTPGSKGGKPSTETESEEKPKKATKKVVDEDETEKALTHEDIRGQIVKAAGTLGWDPAPPKIMAFTKKFAEKHDLTDDAGETIQRIPQIPVKKLKAFSDAIKELTDI